MCRAHLQAAITLVAMITAAAPALAQAPADAFFDDTVLHEIFLVINTKDWQSLKANAQDNTYYPVDFKWRDQSLSGAGIRSRGTGSRSGTKPGLRVDFDRWATGQKFLGTEKSLVLRNDVQDPSTMRERIAMLVFRRMSVAASREAHAKLYVNNEFVGLYTLVESVDKPFLLKSLNEDGGYLYKYDYNVTDPPYYLEWRDDSPASYVPHPFKPETNESDPRAEVVQELVRIINKDSDAVFRSTVAPFIDFTNFIKHIAIEICLGDNDGFNGNWGTNNFYVYRFANKNLFWFIPWDKSNAFLDGPQYSIWHNILDMPESKRNRLTMRMLGFGDLRTQFLDTLAACGDLLGQTDPASPADTRGWMEREVEREYGQIKNWAAVAPEDTAYYSKAQFEQGVEDLRNFARNRSASLKEQVAQSR